MQKKRILHVFLDQLFSITGMPSIWFNYLLTEIFCKHLVYTVEIATCPSAVPAFITDFQTRLHFLNA